MTGWLAPLLIPGLSAVVLVCLLAARFAGLVFEAVRRARLAWFARTERQART